MDLGLKGRVALVAGGSLGLGRAVAAEFAREGAHVAIGALDDSNLQEAVEFIKKQSGGGCICSAGRCVRSRPGWRVCS